MSLEELIGLSASTLLRFSEKVFADLPIILLKLPQS